MRRYLSLALSITLILLFTVPTFAETLATFAYMDGTLSVTEKINDVHFGYYIADIKKDGENVDEISFKMDEEYLDDKINGSIYGNMLDIKERPWESYTFNVVPTNENLMNIGDYQQSYQVQLGDVEFERGTVTYSATTPIIATYKIGGDGAIPLNESGSTGDMTADLQVEVTFALECMAFYETQIVNDETNEVVQDGLTRTEYYQLTSTEYIDYDVYIDGKSDYSFNLADDENILTTQQDYATFKISDDEVFMANMNLPYLYFENSQLALGNVQSSPENNNQPVVNEPQPQSSPAKEIAVFTAISGVSAFGLGTLTMKKSRTSSSILETAFNKMATRKGGNYKLVVNEDVAVDDIILDGKTTVDIPFRIENGENLDWTALSVAILGKKHKTPIKSFAAMTGANTGMVSITFVGDEIDKKQMLYLTLTAISKGNTKPVIEIEYIEIVVNLK